MLALDYHHQEDSQGQPFDRLETRNLVCHLHAEYSITLALKDGRIAVTPEKPPLSEEAREIVRANKAALLTYLTTPPDEPRPCAHCERAGQWVLDWMAIWVCDCYYHPEYRTPAGPAPSTQKVSDQGRTLAEYWQASASVSTIEPENGHRTGQAGQQTPVRASAIVRETSASASGESRGQADARKPEIARVTIRESVQRDQETPSEDEMIGIGVLTEDSLYHWTPGAQDIECHPLARTVQNIEDMYMLACQYRLHSLWLCPGNPLCLTYKEQAELFAPDALADRYKVNVRHKEKSVLPTSATIYPKSGPRGHRPMIRVFLPDFDPTWLEDLDDQEHSWCFSDVTDARLFLETLILIFERLGVYLATSPAQTGIDSMQAHTRPGDWSHSEQEIKLPHFEELDIHWKRPLTSQEQGLYLHKFDRNSMYLASTTGADKGTGTPDHLNEEEAVRAFSEGAMGIWEVTIQEPAQWPILDGVDTARLPHNSTWTGKGWLTTPGLKSYLAMGYEHTIHQGRIWFNKKGRADIGKRRALKDWASHLFKVRQELKAQYGSDHPAYKLIKMIANRSLGWLDLSKVRGRVQAGCEVKDVPWYYAPYYYQEIKGLARLRMVLKMLELVRDEEAEEEEQYPVLVFTDCFGLLSKEADARRAFPKLLARENELGGFKYDGSFLVTPDVIEAFSEDHPASDTLHLLKVIEREGRAHA